MSLSPKAEWIMAQLLRRLFCSLEQTFEGVQDRLAPDFFAVASEEPAVDFGAAPARTPAEAYGTHWLTR
jgi:hypothetical protein